VPQKEGRREGRKEERKEGGREERRSHFVGAVWARDGGGF
jgi:hypothetical protein